MAERSDIVFNVRIDVTDQHLRLRFRGGAVRQSFAEKVSEARSASDGIETAPEAE